ncbi:GIY-YIG nuclease family protein [Salegentibacter maritimus]|uniref:GIY-YIG nuclease family protein n=1 Tax=Salegentibacter maritimus TaxID=2794347 RepID=UPI0018E49B90|nr:GIY-YIG nuclease family protein [Salegentibacter maritimus]MBI6115341.1 GIY-YIG nuclease family protein [Salegentibacter maritimus]
MNNYVYILTNKNRSVLYIGSTKNLVFRLRQHRLRKGAKFTRDYNVFDLIYFEIIPSSRLAKAREKQLKNWHKSWKWNLIKKFNPTLISLKLNSKGPETSSGHN